MPPLIQNSLGRISITSDIWSRGNLEPYMAITAHYFVNQSGRLTLQSRLIAFRILHGSHTGLHMADLCMNVLEEFEITNKVLTFVMILPLTHQ